MKNLKNEPGNLFKTLKPTAPVLPYSQGPAASAISGDEDCEFLRRVFVHKSQGLWWKQCPIQIDAGDTQVCSSSRDHFCSVTTENGDQQDICKSDHYAVCTTIMVPQ